LTERKVDGAGGTSARKSETEGKCTSKAIWREGGKKGRTGADSRRKKWLRDQRLITREKPGKRQKPPGKGNQEQKRTGQAQVAGRRKCNTLQKEKRGSGGGSQLEAEGNCIKITSILEKGVLWGQNSRKKRNARGNFKK